ncbi:unnamed protein product [Sphenostylis stenocarpa]|uniref:Bromo domain-containing protein n=1 Tax=Sphenostylis stenocarpa TaxID=92480 RepID=A0AA86S4N9_9FABA|nr:unnamed protein product [Sphenostylis stenocarpa]
MTGEAGWTPDQWGHSRFRSLNVSTDNATNQKHLSGFMRSLLKASFLDSMHDHADAWPFKDPVDARDVPDYYDIIKDPMDLKTMSKRVESELYYVTFEMFVADVRRMFANARTYNSPETIYYKCATRHVPTPGSPFPLPVMFLTFMIVNAVILANAIHRSCMDCVITLRKIILVPDPNGLM